MRFVVAAVLTMVAGDALAQSGAFWQQWYGERRLLVDLLAEGYEIKASVRLSESDILYVQKGKYAYRCLGFGAGNTVRLNENTLDCQPLQKPALRQ